MANAPSLDERILKILKEDCAAAEAGRVRDEAERELASMTALADQADTDALDPMISAREAGDLRSKADGLRFEQDRLGAKVAALSVRVANLLDREARSASQNEQGAAIAERDKLAEDIARDYPRIVAELTSLVRRIVSNDARLQNAKAHVLTAEMIARNLQGNFVHADGVSGAFRLKSIKLPLPDRPGLAFESTSSGWRFPGLDI
jgi:hypothetical protein